MALLPLLRSRRAQETEALEQRVSTLQTALRQCTDIARRRTHFQREFTLAVAVAMLALGFALGVYREPIAQSFAKLGQTIGLAKPTPDADAAEAAYQKGKYASALKLAHPLAEAGDAHAQFLLGLIYYRGRAVAQDYNEAATWFGRAADQGNATAQFYLGVMYTEGKGVPKDSSEATKWYRLAADRGDAEAQYNLGLSYATGEAAEPDNVSAYMWFDLAAARFAPSDTRRHAAVTSRDLLGNKMTLEQIIEAQKRARAWRPK